MTPRNLVICAFAIFSGACGGVAEYVFEEGNEDDGEGDGTAQGNTTTSGNTSGTGSGTTSTGSTSGSSGSMGSTGASSGSTGASSGSSGSTGSTGASSGSTGSTGGSGATSGGSGSTGGWGSTGGSTGGWGSTAGSTAGFWPIDPSTCSNYSSSSNSGYCNLDVQCTDTWASISCNAYSGSDQSECYCNRQGGSVTMQMDTSLVGSGTACQKVSDVCLGLSDLSATGPADCSQRYLQSYDSYCSANLLCLTPIQVNGVGASLQTNVDAWCNESYGSTVCECYSSDRYASVTIADDDFSSQSCTDVVKLCQDTVFDPSLPSECTPRSQYSQGESCSFNLECSQDRVLSGKSAVVSIWQYGGCQQTADGQWSCSCGDGSSAFDVTSSSGWETCSAASERCAAR